MARRRAYTKLEKEGQSRPPHVQGMGDVVFKVFQCLEPNCQEFIFIRSDSINADFKIPCSACEFELTSGGETKFFDYTLVEKDPRKIVEAGPFVILHDDYLAEAHSFKHCLNCYTLKPVEFFDRHASRVSGYQGECRLCKTIYNGIKNQTRTTDQHREAAQRRRLYRLLAEEGGRIDSTVIFEKFEGKCFKCNTELTHPKDGGGDFNLDHTLPAKLLWPMTTDNSTLLCAKCNNEKHDHWPSEFYSIPKLKRLAILTGYEYSILKGQQVINEDAVAAIVEDTDGFIETWIHNPDDIRKVRRLIQEHNGVDIFKFAKHVPSHLLEPGEAQDAT